MKIRSAAYVITLACSVLLSLHGWSQSTIEFRSPGNDSVKVVIIQNAENYKYLQKDSSGGLTFLTGNVKLQQEKTLIYCDSMVLAPKDNYIESFGHVHINDNDSVNIYSDYMKYAVDKKTLLFQKNVRLTDGKGTLTTQELQYDLNQKVGVYLHGGKVVNNGSLLTSEEGTYYEATKDVYFRKNVKLNDKQYDLSADSLLYNTQTQISTFITETYIVFKDSSHRTVRTREGYYDLRNKKAQFGKRAVITDGSQRITGDDIQFNDSTGVSIARGNAVYKDTAQGISMIANLMISNKKKSTFLATQKPLLILKQDKDSIYITADSFFSGRVVDAEAAARVRAAEDSIRNRIKDSLLVLQMDSLALEAKKKVAGKEKADRNPKDSLNLKDSLQQNLKYNLQQNLKDNVKENPKDRLKMNSKDSLYIRTSDSTHRSVADTASHAALDSSQHIVLDNRANTETDTIHHRIDETRIPPPDTLQQNARVPPIPPAVSNPSHGRSTDSLKRVTRPNRPPHKGIVSPSVPAADSLGHRLPDSLNRAPKDSLRVAPPDSTGTPPVSIIPTTDSNLRYIQGYYHVRIYSDSLQAVADSMWYSGKDSVFRLYKNPIAWSSGTNQITGDTMFVYTRNKKARRLYVFENALAINKVGPNFYNQIKGNTINAYFRDGVIDYIRAKGNAESIYYTQDEVKAYVGVNKAKADIIDMIFRLNKEKANELNRVVLRNDAEGTMSPMKKVDFNEMRLRGFKWHEEKRPKTKYELFQ